jgi:4-hydroxybutyrate CoA-transferase
MSTTSARDTSHDWREIYQERRCTPAEAVADVRSGDIVLLPITPPVLLPNALWQRHDELENVTLRLQNPGTDPGWMQPGMEKHFELEFELYIGDFGRHVMDERRATYLPNLFSLGFKAEHERPAEARPADVAMVTISRPDKHGYCHFGPHNWTKREAVRYARVAIGEIDPSLIAVTGDVWIHISEFDHIVEYDPPEFTRTEYEALLAEMDPARAAGFRSIADEVDIRRLAPIKGVIGGVSPDDVRRFLGITEPPPEARTIAGYLSELIPDRATIQIGTGEPSRLMPALGAFDGKHDLGLHTELGAPGLGRLVNQGVITGRFKTLHPHKAVAAAWTGCDDNDMAIIDGNPVFELYPPEYVVHLRTLTQLDNFWAINSGVQVDLLGQINSESVFGGRMVNGTGGQPELMLGGVNSRGGGSVLMLPATALGGGVSRIVPQFEAGAIITVPRFFADHVITEYGIARLLGKNHRQRAEELISIAHPDFRAQLHADARRLWWP